MTFQKIAAETYLPSPPAEGPPVVVVRKYDEVRDKAAVEELERCEVAEYGDGNEIVGVIRGCIKTVTNGKKMSSTQLPVYVKLAYILGLRVSSTHRRLGIATKLVQELENWCKQNGAEYAYMATECNNKPSLNLFTQKCNYVKFRNPTVLVQPVHLHSKPLPLDIIIVRIPPQLAELVYRNVFSTSEFFPKDIDRLLSNKLNLGTFMALPKKSLSNWNPKTRELPSSFAILSIWDTKEVYRLQVKGVSVLTHVVCLGTRVFDAMVPWLKIPSFPNVFENFGFYFCMGFTWKERRARLMKSLCKFAHNMARNDAGCRVTWRR
ncbi:hypothetical protein DH2020_018776 [Rehmannia glutinosa]|uniref:N-acetyltransferase domain-containing protein n=1 Tax=Rehmannia glutinosa TaxID=99300 RepID=A0ABR0WL90_REHGL